MARRVIRNGSKKVVFTWWKADNDDELCRQLFDYICFLDQEQQTRRERNLQCLRLYGNVDYVGLGPYQYTRTNTANLPENRVRMNICSSMVDTVAAKVSKMKPRTTFLTSGGNFHVQEKARKLDKFVFGAFTANNVYVLHQQMFKDSCIMDIGAIKHFTHEGRICSERVLPSELYVDAADALYGRPSHLYHVKYVHKDILAAAYPEHRAAIMESAGVIDGSSVSFTLEEQDDYVLVTEAWRLPTSKEAKDGKHVIAVEKAVLVKDEWKHNFFPFTFERWSSPIVGWYGQSLVDRLTGNQIEINKMLRTIQRSFHLGSAFKVFLEYGSRVAKEHVNNEIGSLVYYSGQRPEFVVPKTVHEEFFRHLEWLIRSSYEEAGVSQLSAASKMPAGIDGGSGKALREYNDLETERFVLTAQEYESSFLHTARIYIALAREMYEDGEDFEVVAESRRFIESIKWSDIDLEDNEYVMQMFPTSMLPATPAGKLAYVQELLQAGFIQDKAWALSLLDFPDTDAYASLETAPLYDILDTLDRILYKGQFLPPEPFQNLQLGIDIFQKAYLRAKKDNAPETRLELVRRWITLAQAQLDKAAAAQAIQAPGQAQQTPAAVTDAGAAAPMQQAGPPTLDAAAQVA